jgi:hypothetical protein
MICLNLKVLIESYFSQFDELSWSKMQKWSFSVASAAEASFKNFTSGENDTTQYEQQECIN